MQRCCFYHLESSNISSCGVVLIMPIINVCNIGMAALCIFSNISTLLTCKQFPCKYFWYEKINTFQHFFFPKKWDSPKWIIVVRCVSDEDTESITDDQNANINTSSDDQLLSDPPRNDQITSYQHGDVLTDQEATWNMSGKMDYETGIILWCSYCPFESSCSRDSTVFFHQALPTSELFGSKTLKDWFSGWKPD